MLHEFLTANKTQLIDRCKAKVVARDTRTKADSRPEYGIPHFLGQLIKTLEVERTSQSSLSRKISGRGDGGPDLSEIGVTATLHGRDLMKRGFTVEQVVHDYGDLCQAITDLAVENNVPIGVEEFRTLNRCLDNGIADAVTEFGYQQKLVYDENGIQAQNERLGFRAHELRNFIGTATLATAAIKSGGGDRVLIDVEDHCGGLPPGDPEKLFESFTQHGADRSGLGLGLSISRRSVEANAGLLRIRDIPGSGCVFTIDLPRHALSH